MIASTALAQAERNGILKLSGCGLNKLDVLWIGKNSHKIDYSFDSNELRWWECATYIKVDLSDNLLSQLDDRLSEWEYVKTIDLRKNAFTQFPSILSQLPALTKLNISKNQLERIVCDLISTVDLDASLNRIIFFSASIPNIHKIDLSHNKLTQVPVCLQECRYLVSLNLAYNLISECENSLDGLKSLCDLDMSHNNLIQVFNKHTILPNLVRLTLNHNVLSKIPHGKFLKLTDLIVSYNQISHKGKITESDGDIDILKSALDLQVLDLCENKLLMLPEGIFSLKSLKRLDFSNNSVRNLPPELGLLASLQTITYFGNPVKVPNGFGTEKLLKWLRNKLPLENNMNDFQIHVQDVINVDLENSKINTITREMVQNMPRSLRLSGNLISYLDIIFDFGNNLSILELGRNRIREFPIKSLPVLRYLDISCNQIKSIEFSQKQFPKLDYLNISFNQFSQIPNLEVFPRLTQLLANDNKIYEINPLTFLQLEFLKILELSNNSIRVLPNELGLLPHLNFLGLAGNVFKYPSQGMIRKGTSAIIEFLRQGIKKKD